MPPPTPSPGRGMKRTQDMRVDPPRRAWKGLPEDSLKGISLRFYVTKVGEKTPNMHKYTLLNITCDESTLHVKDFWARNLVLKERMTIHLVDVSKDENNVYTIDRNNGFLIIEPNSLMSVTSIVSQLWCPRKAALGVKFNFPKASEDMFRGTVAHDLITQAMLNDVKKPAELQKMLEQILSKPCNIQQAFGLNLTAQQVKTTVRELASWVTRFMTTVYKTAITRNAGQTMEILTVKDIEDNYWNPVYGIKGKLDATIRVKTKEGKILTIPLEFKTGNPTYTGGNKSRLEHLAQVDLYSLLLTNRYGFVEKGALYYISEMFWQERTVKPIELKQLIKMRNDLATGAITKDGVFTDLPRPDTVEYRKCESCEYKNTCQILLKKDLDNSGPPKTDSERKLMEDADSFSSEERKFFNQWFTVITMEIEEGEIANKTSQLWLTHPDGRKNSGNCLNELELIIETVMEYPYSAANSKHLATFRRDDGASLVDRSDIRENDLVILGTYDEYCICYCTVHSFDPIDNTITVCMDTKLNERSCRRGTIFTLDKMPFKSPIAVQYTYLDALFGNSPSQRRLREYLIMKKQPVFGELSVPAEKLDPILAKFNPNQQVAIKQALRTDSFLFVQGVPGAGKTHTILGLLEALSTCGKSVLVVAYTGVALDNILLKYKKIGRNFVRVGDSSRLRYPELKGYYTSELAKGSKNVDEFRAKLKSATIVATTMLSLKHEIFKVRTFDYVIIDEASQALPTAVFGSLLFGDKYILFGDPEQLPPVMQTDATNLMEVKDNMFSMLSTPENTQELVIQYRMNAGIMGLANELVYKDKMKTSDEVAQFVVPITKEKADAYLETFYTYDLRSWVKSVIGTKADKSVVFLDTSNIEAYDVFTNDKSFINKKEGNIVMESLKAFIQVGLPSSEIGLISPYRGQVELLRGKCKQLGRSYANVEVNTVDQYQGREKTVIICSFVRCIKEDPDDKLKTPYTRLSRGPIAKFSILDDMRRLNVAITRAKCKLIIVGSKQFLTRIPAFETLFSKIRKSQTILLTELDVESLTYFTVSPLDRLGLGL